MKNNDYIKIEKNKWVKKTDIKELDHKEKNFTKIFKKILNVKYFGGKHLEIVQHYYKYSFVTTIHFIQEIRKIRLSLRKRM